MRVEVRYERRLCSHRGVERLIDGHVRKSRTQITGKLYETQVLTLL